MTVRRQLMKLLLQEDINFLLTNRIPRRAVTRFLGWFSQIEKPAVRAVCRPAFLAPATHRFPLVNLSEDGTP